MKNKAMMFNNISERYDLMNDIISLGLHKFIKKMAINNLHLKNGMYVLDMCTGTGDIIGLLLNRKENIHVCGVDYSEGMLDIAKSKYPSAEFVNSNCEKLPFADESFDAVTMFFGYRNIDNKDAAMKELIRILKPYGKFLHFDFGKSSFVFNIFFSTIVKLVIKTLSPNKIAYEYLLDSKNNFKAPNLLIKEFEEYGLKCTSKKNYLFGMISAQYFEKTKF